MQFADTQFQTRVDKVKGEPGPDTSVEIEHGVGTVSVRGDPIVSCSRLNGALSGRGGAFVGGSDGLGGRG